MRERPNGSPFARNRAGTASADIATTADSAGTYAYPGHPAVVATPATSMLSLTAYVSPASGQSSAAEGAATRLIHTSCTARRG